MSILALDLGTTTGWAIKLPDHDRIISGTQSFKPARFEGGGMRFVRFAAWLDEMHSLYPVGKLYFEEVRNHKGVDAAHVYGGLMAHLQAWAETNQIPYLGVPVGVIKKNLTGRGNANKALMIATVKQRGFNPADDNEADAIALLLCSSALP